MQHDLFEALSEDEFDLLAAKLECARVANRKLEYDLYELLDAIDSDYPFNQRMADLNNYSTPEWSGAVKVSDALNRIGDRAHAHRAIRDELHKILYA